ncbi:variable large family protein [Borreliella burgdorferi]|uniref:variable large family protein n=1 Tax=Borreliella burgdorferi TaxID=139 RepID=UPI000D0251D2|nr:variable large family protein [Borreliella burgdorferi]MCD2383951.1 variable large family protein [Borreliella burgdorferi]MCD2390086.1 variable large family protein [Borreliella burgdorferi]MCD2394811.1 variable large family protein [Borreliella burgdorferi]MCD2396123.1 variable large family protein [Borreliella burgdorferi]MCD2397340.1 variable large family protein [Borreliella burgdorferi]
MKKITSLVFILPLFVLITCKNTVSDEVIKNKLLNSIETLGKEFSDAFISSPFGGSLGTAAIDLKKSEVRNYFETISKGFKKIQEGFKKISFDFAEYDNAVYSINHTAKGFDWYLMEFVNDVEEAAKAADIDSDLVGQVVAVNLKIADSSSVKRFANWIQTLLRFSMVFGYDIYNKMFKNINIDSSNHRKHIQQVGNVTRVGKIFLKKENDSDSICYDNSNYDNVSTENKAKELVNSVSGEEILHLLLRDIGGSPEHAKGKSPYSSENHPIEAAIGTNNINESGAPSNCFTYNQPVNIATAIVLRGLAKDGQFFAINGENDTVKTAVEIGVTKTLVALTTLLKGSVGEMIGRLLDEIRKSSLRHGVLVENNGYRY